jgi:hypothetical protein
MARVKPQVWVVVAIVLAAVAGDSVAGGARQPGHDPCPPVGATREVASVDRVLDGAHASIHRLFPKKNHGQGRTDPVTRRTTHIREVVALSRTSNDATAFRRVAARVCGARIARASWAVVANFPLSPMASASQVAFFLVNTSGGWKLYGSVLDHH